MTSNKYTKAIKRIVAVYQPIRMMHITARLMLELDEVSTFDMRREIGRLVGSGELVEDDQFRYRSTSQSPIGVTLTVRVGHVEGTVTRPLLAELASDNEENVARLADQLVRDAVRRYYDPET